MARVGEAAVQNGVLHHASNSQIKDFNSCERYWGFSKILRLPTPPSKALAIGTRTHTEEEHYYLDGTLPSHPALLAALSSMPPRSPDILVEQPLTDPVLVAAGVPVEGYIDLLVPPPDVHVYDLKTTSSLSYAKSEEDLLRDVQLGLYARWAHLRFPEARSLLVSLVYVSTDGSSDFRIVTAKPEPHHLEETWRHVEASVVRMRAAATATSMASLSPTGRTTGYCWAYRRRCPFYDACAAADLAPVYVTPPPPLESTAMSLADLLRKNTSTSAPVIATGIVPPDAPPPWKPSETMQRAFVNEAAPPPAQVITETEDSAETKPKRARAAKTTKSPAVNSEGEVPLKLYVGAIPFPGAYSSLDEYVARIKTKVETKFGVGDMRLVDKSSPLAYAGWRGAVSLAVKEEPLTGTWVSLSSDEITQEVVAALRPTAGLYVVQAG